MPALDDLKARLLDIHNLSQASAVLGWDQRVYMPPRGAEARARQLATLAKFTHEMFVAPETRDLLAAAESAGAKLPADSDDAALLRVARRDMTKATKVPTALIVALTETCALAEDVWARARENNDYKSFAPWLAKVYELKRQYAEAIGYQGRIYDALLDDFEEGMTAADLDPIFEELKTHTIPLVAAIAAQQDRVSDGLLRQDFPEDLQERFSVGIIKDCGYSFDRGRLDKTVHPFCTNFSPNDVRITTRYERNWLPCALFGCMHEMGHAFYEMNVAPAMEGTPLGGGVSLGIHESQSRLWENLVGRSREFWRCYFPRLQATFPAQFGTSSAEAFYKAINGVTPSLIRVEADEVTYNLHIILRYEMEQELLEQRLSIADAPARWNEKMKSYLGLTPPSDREGILQDIHWSGGGIGYFPTYTLGNILSVQFFEAATARHPEIPAEIAQGHFGTLYAWLQTNIHQFGRKYPPRELITRATGRPLEIAPYARYLKRKFSAIYEL